MRTVVTPCQHDDDPEVVPEDLGVHVGVAVDEARGDDAALGVDLPRAPLADATRPDDAAVCVPTSARTRPRPDPSITVHGDQRGHPCAPPQASRKVSLLTYGKAVPPVHRGSVPPGGGRRRAASKGRPVNQADQSNQSTTNLPVDRLGQQPRGRASDGLDGSAVGPADQVHGHSREHVPNSHQPAPAVPPVHRSADGSPLGWWVYEDHVRPHSDRWWPRRALRPRTSLGPIAFDEMRPGCYDPVSLADMDINQVERSLCFPMITRFAGQIFLDANDKDLALRCVRAYNDWMIDDGPGHRGRLIRSVVPLWDANWRRRDTPQRRSGCRACDVHGDASHLGLPSIHDPTGLGPFSARSNNRDRHLHAHRLGVQLVEASPFAPLLGRRRADLHQRPAVDGRVALSGHLARVPVLKIAYSESQIGWMPFILERLDNAFHTSRA